MLLFRLVGIRFAHSASSFILSRQVQLGYHTLSVHEARVRAAGYRSFLAILLGALMLNKYAAVRIRHHLDKHKGCHDARFRLLAVRQAIELRIALEEAAELNDLPDLGSENLQFLLHSLLQVVKRRLAVSLPNFLALGFCCFGPLEQVGVVGQPFAFALDHAHYRKYIDNVIGASLLSAVIRKVGIDVVPQVFEHDPLLLLDLLDGDVSDLADHFVVVVHGRLRLWFRVGANASIVELILKLFIRAL